MIREIKFRAWDTKDEWMHHNIQEGIIFDDESHYSFSDFLNNEGYHEYELMQFTGLKDKKKTEIYDKDWVNWPGGAGGGQVYWSDTELQWMIIGKDGGKVSLAGFPPDFLEVIGNIYENPELLEEPR